MYFVLDQVHMHTCISSLLGIYGNFRMKQKSVPSTSALGQRMNGNKSIWNKIWCWERRKVGHCQRQSQATWPNGAMRVRGEGVGMSQNVVKKFGVLKTYLKHNGKKCLCSIVFVIQNHWFIWFYL